MPPSSNNSANRGYTNGLGFEQTLWAAADKLRVRDSSAGGQLPRVAVSELSGRPI